MGKYQRTKYPGIHQYIGRKGTIYVIDYYVDGKKHREKVSPLLGEARKRLSEVKTKTKSEGYVSQSVKKKITLETIISAYRESERQWLFREI